jgi:ABC-2 type transport system permease protein
MNKISLIIAREYLSRVRTRAFILTTFLTPTLFVLFIFGTAYLSIKGKQKMNIAVVDANGFFKNNLKSDDDIKFSFPEGVDTTNYLKKDYSAILIIPKLNAGGSSDYIIRSEKSLGSGSKSTIEDKINAAIEDNMLQNAGINKTELDSIHTNSQTAKLHSFEEHGDKAQESNEDIAAVVGYVAGILIYLTMLIYGMMVMRGIMEEKTSRIAEVIVSSVKPFQLMMGKIVGIGAVGLTQFFLWIILMFALTTAASAYFSHDTMMHVQQAQQHGPMPGGGGAVMAASPQANQFDAAMKELNTANLPLIIGCFLFYFLGGYLFYASLFAAVGSVVEDVQGSQSLTLPITMPIIFSFIIMTNAVQVPGSPLAVWASIIPFSSPMVMMARIAYGVPGTVPYWQLAASMIVLVLGFLFTTWLAGKIYRTGILLYGKKITWKEMFKWVFVKN